MDGVWTVAGGGDDLGHLNFQFTDSIYHSNDQRDQMLAYAVAGFQQSAAGNCEKTQYTYEADPTQSGCHPPDHPLGRREVALRNASPNPISGGDAMLRVMKCKASMDICNGPNHISEFSLFWG